MKGLAGRTYIVTGGGSGIGAATVKRLITEGCNVVGVDLDANTVQKVIDESGASKRGRAVGANVSDPAQMTALVADAVKHFGALDGVANIAGVRGVGSILDTDRKTWDLNIQVNLEGILNTCQAYCRYAKGAGSSRRDRQHFFASGPRSGAEPPRLCRDQTRCHRPHPQHRNRDGRVGRQGQRDRARDDRDTDDHAHVPGPGKRRQNPQGPSDRT